MKYIGKGIATVAIWGGVAGLCFMFHSFNLLDGGGAAFLCGGAFILTAAMWKVDIWS